MTHPDPHQDPTPEDLIRSRVVDRGDGLLDWDELEAVGRTDPLVWHRLARDLRTDCEIRAVMGRELKDPVLGGERERAPGAFRQPTTANWTARVGWAAAALVGVLWWTDRPAAPRVVMGPGSTEMVGPLPVDGAPGGGTVAANDAGGGSSSVLGDRLPGMLVRATPEANGEALRVVYVHRELREAVVDQAFDVAGDGPLPVPVAVFDTPTDF